MLRLRLALLGLASGLLVTMSGCAGFNSTSCSEPRLCGRIFNGNGGNGRLASRHTNGTECECHGAHMPSMIDYYGSPGPQFVPGHMPPGMVMPSPTPIPITNVPMTQPPAAFRVPQAPAVPYAPTLQH
jgi:hypothetical protein